MRDMKLVEATVVTDDSTGCYTIGELDFGVPGTTVDWLDGKPGRRKLLADHLRWLADMCERSERPFAPISETVRDILGRALKG